MSEYIKAIDLILLATVLSLGVVIGVVSMNLYLDHQYRPIAPTELSEVPLAESANSLRAELRTFYKYNITNLNDEYNETRLREVGGVCWHYSEWYAERMQDLGYYTTLVVMPLDEETSHEVAIASNPKGYCVLDQLNVHCFDLVESNKTYSEEL